MSEQDRLASDLRLAVARGEITARFQPQVDIRDGRIVAIEALSRWQHPQRGMVPPLEFIPLAEETGVMVEVGDAMLEVACRYGTELAATGLRIEIAVNVAAAQLSEADFADDVARHVETTGMPAELLTLELTESHPSPAEAAGLLAEVRDIGVGVSIDDVRTVEEAQVRTRALPVTEIKIDRSVIQRLPDDRTEARRLLGFARKSGFRAVAEGIETERQLDAVRELGFDRAQGYLLGRPLTPGRLMPRLGAMKSPSEAGEFQSAS